MFAYAPLRDYLRGSRPLRVEACTRNERQDAGRYDQTLEEKEISPQELQSGKI